MLVTTVKMIPTSQPKTMIVEMMDQNKFLTASMNLDGKETTAILIMLEYLAGNANFLNKPAPALEALGFTVSLTERKL